MRSEVCPGSLYEESRVRHPSGWAKMTFSNTFSLPASILGRAGGSAVLKIVWSCLQPSTAGQQQHLSPS